MLDPAYLDFLRTLPCWACNRRAYEVLAGMIVEFATERCLYSQASPTEAAHVGLSTSHRGVSQKFPDPESLPLCREEHHQHGEFSIHVMGAEAFFAHHGGDRDEVILRFQALYREHCK